MSNDDNIKLETIASTLKAVRLQLEEHTEKLAAAVRGSKLTPKYRQRSQQMDEKGDSSK